MVILTERCSEEEDPREGKGAGAGQAGSTLSPAPQSGGGEPRAVSTGAQSVSPLKKPPHRKPETETEAKGPGTDK